MANGLVILMARAKTLPQPSPGQFHVILQFQIQLFGITTHNSSLCDHNLLYAVKFIFS